MHPEYQSRPAHGWFPKGQKTAIKTTSGRKRVNIQGALDLETLELTRVQGETINAETTLQLPKKIEKNTSMRQYITSYSTMRVTIMPRCLSHGLNVLSAG